MKLKLSLLNSLILDLANASIVKDERHKKSSDLRVISNQSIAFFFVV
jgi:hypothetical protein